MSSYRRAIHVRRKSAQKFKRRRRRGPHHDHDEPPRKTQRALNRNDGGTPRRAKLDRKAHRRARRDHRRQRPRILSRPRSRRTVRPRPRVLPLRIRSVRAADANDSIDPAAGDRARPRDRNRRRMPTGRNLRPRRCRRERQLRNPRRKNRPVLLNPDGSPDPRSRPKTRDGNAADRPVNQRPHRSRMGPGKPSSPRRRPDNRNKKTSNPDRRGQPANSRNRQTSLLQPNRPTPTKSLRIHKRSNEPKRHNQRRPRRNHSLPKKTKTNLVRPVKVIRERNY